MLWQIASGLGGFKISIDLCFLVGVNERGCYSRCCKQLPKNGYMHLSLNELDFLNKTVKIVYI